MLSTLACTGTMHNRGSKRKDALRIAAAARTTKGVVFSKYLFIALPSGGFLKGSIAQRVGVQAWTGTSRVPAAESHSSCMEHRCGTKGTDAAERHARERPAPGCGRHGAARARAATGHRNGPETSAGGRQADFRALRFERQHQVPIPERAVGGARPVQHGAVDFAEGARLRFDPPLGHRRQALLAEVAEGKAARESVAQGSHRAIVLNHQWRNDLAQVTRLTLQIPPPD